MKRIFPILALVIFLFGCSASLTPSSGEFTLTDAFGNACPISPDAKIVSCYASFADMWLLAGGCLAGVTEDAITEHQLDVPQDTAIVGSVKHIDMEKLVSLDPDYVFLSADLTAHLALQDSLEAMGIPHGYFRVDIFEDYKNLMAQFCAITGREDLYQAKVLDVEREIAEIKAKIPETSKSVLLIRAYSTGMKAKTSDNLAGQILEEFGLLNIAAGQDHMLEDLSLEYIVRADPDYIFAMTMGKEEGALEYLEENARSNPLWASLTAVQSGNFHMLPKDLFHYKPNDRWSESYAYFANLIWPEIFPG